MQIPVEILAGVVPVLMASIGYVLQKVSEHGIKLAQIEAREQERERLKKKRK